MIDNPKLPSFLIIGAQKAGTTTLHEWLAQHPSVCLPIIKETHFFRDENNYERGLSWYSSWFKPKRTTQLLGEIDPDYIYFRDAATRIRATIGTPKLTMILRNPLERAYSHYMMSVRRGYEDLEFADALARESQRIRSKNDWFSMIHHSYLSRGRYCGQIREFRKVIPESEWLFLKFDELRTPEGRVAIFNRVCDFIGAEGSIEEIDLNQRANSASEPRFKIVRNILYGRSRFRRALGLVMPFPSLKLRLGLLLDRLNQKPLQCGGEGWIDTVPQSIRVTMEGEISGLEDLTGLSFTDWRT